MKTKTQGRVVHQEPDEFKHWEAERCSECGKDTRFWLEGGQIPLCPECAKKPGKKPVKK